MYFLEYWLKTVTKIEGFAAEGFVITTLTIFIVLVLAFRHFRERQGENRFLLIVNMNRLTIGLCLSLLVTYLVLLIAGPVCFDTPYGFYSDHIIYVFRIVLVAFFIGYFVYLAVQTDPHLYYTFEYYFIMFGAMLGLSIMCICSNFLNLLLAMELYSVCIYYLINDKRGSIKTHEAAFKYFVVSSFSTAFYIFGVFWVYYNFGSFEYQALSIVGLKGSVVGAIGYFFILCALMVKVGAGVFFFWILDAYEGASYPILIFLNLFVKPVFLLVIFKTAILSGSLALFWIFQKLFFASAMLGSLGAALQSKIKRFLIFTSLYNTGFLSCFFWDPTYHMLNGFIAFFFIYTVNSFCLMYTFSQLVDEKAKFVIVDIKDLSSIMPQDSRFAFALIYFLLAISGLPPFSLFFVKYYLFFKFAHVGTGYVLILLLTSALATFYYIRTIRLILQERRPTFLLTLRKANARMFAFVTVFNLYFVFFAEHLIEFLNNLPL